MRNSFYGDKLQFEVISFLRFPLIVAVVLMHTKMRVVNGVEAIGMHEIYPFGGLYPLYENTVYFFTQVFLPVRVPLFFFFSGFLFFYKIVEMRKSVYINKLKNRVHSLLIPYLFWNILFIFVYNVSGMLFPGTIDSYIGEGYQLKDWLLLLYNPASYQLWFIRDLMVVVLFTPIIWWLTRKYDFMMALFLGVLWLMALWTNGSGFPITAFFFFSLGGYFSINKKNFIEIVYPYTKIWGVLYVIFAALTCFYREYEWSVYLKQLSVIGGIAFVVALSSYYVSNGKWKVNKFLAESSFFIYAYHVIALPIIKRIIQIFIPLNTDIQLTIFYFVWAFLAVAIGLIGYYLLKKMFPKPLSVITGGR